jgi:transcription initiation factor TFIID subunit TAF12
MKMDLEKNPDLEIPTTVPSIANMDDNKVVTRLSFNDVDQLSDGSMKTAPKDVDTLEQLSIERNLQRKLEEAMDEDEDEEGKDKIKIHMDENVTLDDIFDLDKDLNASVDNLDLGAEDL